MFSNLSSQRFNKSHSPKVVQERLGHSRIDMTMGTYSHVVPSLQEDAANNMNVFLQQKYSESIVMALDLSERKDLLDRIDTPYMA